MTHPELPPELRLASFKNVENLAALHVLIRSSPVANATFNEYPDEIIATVVRRLPKELQQIIRACGASLCNPNLDIPLIEKSVLFNRETSYNTTTEVEDALPPISFDLPLPVLRQLLEVAHRIHLLCTIFFKTHIKRLNSLRPQHLAKSNFAFGSYPFKKYPDGREYTPAKTGAASWVEEYRITRALWRLQFFCLLTKQGTRAVKSDDEAAFVECSVPYRQHEFAKIISLWTRWENDEILGVQDYLDETRISLRAPTSTAEDPARPSSASVSTVSTSNSNLSGSGTTNSSPTTPGTPASVATPSRPPPMAPPDIKAAENTHLRLSDLIAVKRSTEAYNFFHRYGLRHPTSPLQRSRWEHFRRLGFGIWDQERMCQMELFRMPASMRDKRGGKDLSIDDVAFTWKSVEDAGVPEHAHYSSNHHSHMAYSPVSGSLVNISNNGSSSNVEDYSGVNGYSNGRTPNDYSQAPLSPAPQHRSVLSLSNGGRTRSNDGSHRYSQHTTNGSNGNKIPNGASKPALEPPSAIPSSINSLHHLHHQHHPPQPPPPPPPTSVPLPPQPTPQAQSSASDRSNSLSKHSTALAHSFKGLMRSKTRAVSGAGSAGGTRLSSASTSPRTSISEDSAGVVQEIGTAHVLSGAPAPVR